MAAKPESRVGLPIPGCQKARMIAFFPDGTYQMKKLLCDCNFCNIGLFSQCVDEEVDIEMNPEFEKEINDVDETKNFVVSDVFTFVEEGNYIGLYSSNHFELFYVLLVTKKGIAEETKLDLFGHIVQEGQYYLEGNYLEKIKETKKKIFYKKISKTVFVQPHEIFMPTVSINSTDLSL